MNKLDERGWKRLTAAIKNGEVVPIIGKELFKVNGESLQKFVNKQICNNFFIDYDDSMTVDQIIDAITAEEGDGKRKYCNELSRIFSDIKVEVPECIGKLIDINRFPMVLTTCYAPILERYLSMRNDRKWEFYSYDTTSKGDIPSAILDNPILYYIFGEIGFEGTFVVDEEDLLSFLHFWHDENNRPKELCRYLSNKYLLVIGCDYPDWLFRFLWYSMNNNFNEKKLKKGQLVISNNKVKEDKALQSFLRRIKAYYDTDIEEFVNELYKRCEALDLSAISHGDPLNDKSSAKVDFFISYANEDFDRAKSIATELKNLGATVWFDKNTLKPGDKFPEEIQDNIQGCERFIPILSKNTIQNDRRFFRKEWTIALDESKYRLGMPYITPIVIDDVDIKHHLIPSAFGGVHVLKYNDDMSDQFRNLIRDIRRK